MRTLLIPASCGLLLGMSLSAARLISPDGLRDTLRFRPSHALKAALWAIGTLIAAVPKLLRNRGSYWARESALGCAGAFLCGVGMMMGLHLAGSGRIVSAMLEGSTGAFGFVMMAWIAGCVTALLAGRRRA